MMMTTSSYVVLAAWNGVPLSVRLVALALLVIVGVMAIRLAPMLMGHSYAATRDQPPDRPRLGEGATGADREAVANLMGRSYAVTRDRPPDPSGPGDGAAGADREVVTNGSGTYAWRHLPVGGGDASRVRSHS
jgi:hypothetical protein